MTRAWARGNRARHVVWLAPLALATLAASSEIPWSEMTEADWVYPVATRFATVGGHRVHYPTPTVELAAALQARPENAALRHLAEARRELGDFAGAEAALEKWAEGVGAAPATAPGTAAPAKPELARARAWDEVARWGAAHLRFALAFRAAARALPGLPADEKRALADAQVKWADAHPDAADAVALRQVRARLFPGDESLLEDWIRSLEKANRLPEAEKALAEARSLSLERRLLLRSGFLTQHGEHRRAFEVLDAEVWNDKGLTWSPEFRRVYALAVDRGDPGAAERWRTALDKAFDPAALARLATYFQGQQRGGDTGDLLRQVERRYEGGFDRGGWLLVARLQELMDNTPEAFRARLAAAHLGAPAEQTADLAPLSRLAIHAGGRALAWGTYNDEPYRWVARLDRTPGIWTGGLSFLLTGQDWNGALAHLESESLPDRTFATARLLAAELERRAPGHAELPLLRVAIMRRHVERGEGKEALALLPLVEAAGGRAADEAREVALLAARQVEIPLAEEVRLHRLRLATAAPDGSVPLLRSAAARAAYSESEEEGEEGEGEGDPDPAPADGAGYRTVLDQALSRLETRDPSHRTSLSLLLGEMDRMPDAEDLWAQLATRLEGWNLDDDLGPRYERALGSFRDATWWSRAARWYARRARTAELRRLAEDLALRFRGTELFRRANADVKLELPEQPRVGTRVRLVPWADYVRLKALQRFPQSPTVVNEALAHLITRADWDQVLRRRGAASLAKEDVDQLVIEDALLDQRRWAVLFADAPSREAYFASAAKDGKLEAALLALEKAGERTPVQDQLLFEGWSRLSQYERAAPFADTLAAAYPGDGDVAQRVLSLHRSLAGLDPAHARPARAVVVRTAPALLDPNQLWTELGELEHERGRPEAGMADWKNILARDPNNPERISELATLLWDYGHMPEALGVVEEGRTRIGRPRFFAFETGVLREEVKDAPRAVDEYLAALWPEDGSCCDFESDQRSLRRLAQLMGRERVLALVLARIEALHPGTRGDEEAFASFMPIARMSMPDPGLDWTADDWIDRMDQPNDPVGRAQREEARNAARPQQHGGLDRLTDAMLAKAGAMVAQATRTEFLDATSSWAGTLIDARWEKDRAVGFRSAIMARRAALAPTEEDRIAKEVERARYLDDNGRRGEADALWATLAPRIDALPEGVARMHAEVERVAYVERTRGVDAAAGDWAALSARYPWSLGLLEDRLSFLARHDRGADGRALLAAVIPRAAAGHREALLTRLTQESLQAGDLGPARLAVEQLLQAPLDQWRRLQAVQLLGRLSFKENASFDPLPLARSESAKLPPELQPDLYATLAEAAAMEKAWGTAVTVYIEALNRRTERAWLAQAARSADKAGRAADLLGFFDKQRQRSPRDMRWAVAVRDLKRHANDLPGAIEMAQAAVAVRPEQEDLWRDAVDLMVRADRVGEAADYLEGWNRPRAADEDVARWRGELYLRAGQPQKALAVEKAALAAFVRVGEMNDERHEELRQRTGRAARRLQAAGQPRLAWTLLGWPALPKIAASAYTEGEQAELALLTGTFDRLLAYRFDNTDYRAAAASMIHEKGRPETRQDVEAFLMARLYPPGGGRPGNLQAIWPFAEQAGLDSHLRVAIAQRMVEATPGPWQAAPGMSFLESVGQVAVMKVGLNGQPAIWRLETPNLDALWVRELVRRDDGAGLVAFLGPRWSELLALAAPGDGASTERLAWTAWLDDPEVLAAWTRAASKDPQLASGLARVFSDRRAWDRFWTLAARGWNVSVLVEALPEDARTSWFRFWQQPGGPVDPVRAAREKTKEAVALAVGRLVAGEANAAADPLIEKLRGPRTVGALLAADARWTWPEFTPRRDAKGDITEQGEDRVFGQRMDAGRLPGALWSDRPGEAWYVLEALARYRQRDAQTPLLPLEVPERGGQSQRALLAIRLAEALGDTPLALELEEAFPGRTKDNAWLEMRLRLFARAGQKDKAEALLRQVVRAEQATLDEARFRTLTGLAHDLALTAPLDLLDPATPVSPGFLAYLFDRRGAATAARFTTKDTTGFRAALAHRWMPREGSLGVEQVRYALAELWAAGAMPLPRRGLRKLPGVWPYTADWLNAQRTADRAEALAALNALPDRAAFEAFTARAPQDDVVQRLTVRILLAGGEDDRALALVDGLVRGLTSEKPLEFAAPVVPSGEDAEADEGGEELGGDEEAAAAPAPVSDTLTAQLEAWLAPFRQVRRAAPVEERFRTLLQSRRAEGPVSIDAWRLALELTPPEQRPALLQDVERAWIRGDWSSEELGPLVEVLARLAPEDAPRWLQRWPLGVEYAHVAQRAAIYRTLHDPANAMRVIVEGRRRALWSAADEVHAFDAWRRVAAARPAPAAAGSAAPTAPPATWTAALAFWKMPAGQVAAALEPHLRAHPYDVLGARAALRTPAAGPEEPLRRAALALDDASVAALDDASGDAMLLRLRIARGLLAADAGRAPFRALGQIDVSGLARDLVRRRVKRAEVDEALGDVARIALRGEQERLAEAAMALLIDRRAANLTAVRTELRALARPEEGPAAFRVVNGAPAPYRPRDLTWPVLAAVLAAEEK